MSRRQIRVTIDQDIDNPDKYVLTMEGQGVSVYKGYLFDGIREDSQLINNLKLCRQIGGNTSHIASLEFKQYVNGWGGGIFTAAGRYYVVSVVLDDEATQRYYINFGPTANSAQFGLLVFDNQLDDTEIIDNDGIILNVKSLLKQGGYHSESTLAQLQTYLASKTFWR